VINLVDVEKTLDSFVSFVDIRLPGFDAWTSALQYYRPNYSVPVRSGKSLKVPDLFSLTFL